MGEGFQFLDIIFLAMIAGFIALRLRSVLGRRTGNEPSPSESRRFPGDTGTEGDASPSNEPESFAAALDRSVVDLDPQSPAYFGLNKIHQQDPEFDIDMFVSGARAAYEMILEAFWAGDVDPIDRYISPDVKAGFEEAIRLRQESGLGLDNRLVSIEKIGIEDAELIANEARVTVKLTSHIILVTRDSENRVVEGDVTDAAEVTDIWTFVRDMKSGDPNWILVSTRGGG